MASDDTTYSRRSEMEFHQELNSSLDNFNFNTIFKKVNRLFLLTK